MDWSSSSSRTGSVEVTVHEVIGDDVVTLTLVKLEMEFATKELTTLLISGYEGYDCVDGTLECRVDKPEWIGVAVAVELVVSKSLYMK